jgi:hypothetical protein
MAHLTVGRSRPTQQTRSTVNTADTRSVRRDQSDTGRTQCVRERLRQARWETESTDVGPTQSQCCQSATNCQQQDRLTQRRHLAMQISHSSHPQHSLTDSHRETLGPSPHHHTSQHELHSTNIKAHPQLHTSTSHSTAASLVQTLTSA